MSIKLSKSIHVCFIRVSSLHCKEICLVRWRDLMCVSQLYVVKIAKHELVMPTYGKQFHKSCLKWGYDLFSPPAYFAQQELRYNRNELGSWVRGWDFFWRHYVSAWEDLCIDSVAKLRSRLPQVIHTHLLCLKYMPFFLVRDAHYLLFLQFQTHRLIWPCLYLWEAGAALGQLAVKKGYVLTWTFAHNSLMKLHITICLILISHHFQKTSRFLSFIYHHHLHHT